MTLLSLAADDLENFGRLEITGDLVLNRRDQRDERRLVRLRQHRTLGLQAVNGGIDASGTALIAKVSGKSL